MILNIRYFFVLLTLMLSITSCVSHLSFAKRKYESGYYVEYSKKKTPLTIVKEKPEVVNYDTNNSSEAIKNENNDDLVSKSENISENEIQQNSSTELNNSKTKPVNFNNYFPKLNYYKYFPSDTLIVNQTQKNHKHKGMDPKIKIILFVLLILVFAFLQATITL